jgi:DNA-binding NarL/FixJ family response regulator
MCIVIALFVGALATEPTAAAGRWRRPHRVARTHRDAWRQARRRHRQHRPSPAQSLDTVAAMTATPIRVLVVDDDPLVRVGLRMLLNGDDLVVVGEAGDGAEATRQVDALQPNVVLMDIRMPGVDRLTATETIRSLSDPPEIIVLTTFDADEHVLRALRAGAAGFLLKDTAPAGIINAVHRVVAGDAQLSPSVLRQLITNVTATPPRCPGTPRHPHRTRT